MILLSKHLSKFCMIWLYLYIQPSSFLMHNFSEMFYTDVAEYAFARGRDTSAI